MSEGVYGNQAAGRVTHSLLRLSTAMRSEAWDWAEGAGLTPTQGEILVLLLQRKGPMRLGEIARETQLTAATTSDAVSTLESKGLVEAEWGLSENNRKAKFYRLTSDGRRYLRSEVRTWEAYATAVSKVLSAVQPTLAEEVG